jgi:hypothetical protein
MLDCIYLSGGSRKALEVLRRAKALLHPAKENSYRGWRPMVMRKTN